MKVLLLDKDGKPLLVWQEDVAYRRQTVGFESPEARERYRETAPAGSLVDGQVAPPEEEEPVGEDEEATADCECQS